MSQIHTDQLGGFCTYWATEKLSRTGQRVEAAPINVPCRWVDMTEEMIDEEGHNFLSNAKVYVGLDLSAGGRIAEGKNADIVNASIIRKTSTKDNYDYTGKLRIVWV